MLSVRGIGVAVSVSTSTWLRICLRRSLCVDAEALLLVDDHQAEVLERDVLLQQPVRADDDVDAAGCRVADDAALVAVAAEARQHLDPHREAGEPLPERVEVLLREHRRRDEHGDLRAVHHRLERGAHRDLGLAVADVAADEAVHRPHVLHVALDVADGARLVGRLDVRERRLQLRSARRCRTGRRGPPRPRARRRAASSSFASSCTARRTRAFARGHSCEPRRVSDGRCSLGPT